MSDGWDGCLEAQVDSIVDGLGANDSTLLGVHLEATDNSISLVVLDAIQVSLVDDDVAGDVVRIHSLESFDLLHDHLSVFFGCRWNHFFNKTHVALSAPNEKLPFHHLDKSLNHQVFQKSLIGTLVLCELISDLGHGLLFQFVDILVDLFHFVNPHLVLFLGLSDLHLDFFILELSSEIVVHDFLLLLDVLVVLDCELLLC